jgi:hypothetical protein
MGNCAKFPNKIMSGVTFQAALYVPVYAAPEWSVTAYLRGAGAVDLIAEGDGNSFTFSASAAETGGWSAGTYWVSVRASNGTDVFVVTESQTEIIPDLATASAGFDGRSANEVALAAIEAVLAKRATMDQQRYTIGNRELWRTPMADLLKLRSFYTTQVRRERARSNGCSGFGRPVVVRFS